MPMVPCCVPAVAPSASQAVCRSKSRLCMDPSVGVDCYMRIIQVWMQYRGSHDLMTLLKPTLDLDWKCAPKPSLLAEFSDLARMFAEVLPNTLLSHARILAAVKEVLYIYMN